MYLGLVGVLTIWYNANKDKYWNFLLFFEVLFIIIDNVNIE